MIGLIKQKLSARRDANFQTLDKFSVSDYSNNLGRCRRVKLAPAGQLKAVIKKAPNRITLTQLKEISPIS